MTLLWLGQHTLHPTSAIQRYAGTATTPKPVDNFTQHRVSGVGDCLPQYRPSSAWSEEAGRLAVFRKLDDIKDEAELKKFTAEVTDRFGPIPVQMKELMEGNRLRWNGQRMGLEKMLLKKGTLIGTFIADQKHPFFEGDGFNAVLRAVQAQPRRFKVYEKAGSLRISVQDVKNVQVAKEAMDGG